MRANHPLSGNGSTLAILDANVLLPPRLSDILFDMHSVGLFHPCWTQDIESEFLKNFGPVVFGWNKAERKAIAAAPPEPKHVKAARHRLACFQNAVGEEYQLFGYDDASYVAQVPSNVDPGDVHVVAAALVARAYSLEFEQNDKVFIISNNLKHLAVSDVQALGITVVSPGKFIDQLHAADPERVDAALLKSLSDLNTPPITREALLRTLVIHKATQTAKELSLKWGVAIIKA